MRNASVESIPELVSLERAFPIQGITVVSCWFNISTAAAGILVRERRDGCAAPPAASHKIEVLDRLITHPTPQFVFIPTTRIVTRAVMHVKLVRIRRRLP